MFSCKCSSQIAIYYWNYKSLKSNFKCPFIFHTSYLVIKIQDNLTIEIFLVCFLNSRKKNWPYILQWFKDSYINMGISRDKVICASKPNSHCFIGNSPMCRRRHFFYKHHCKEYHECQILVAANLAQGHSTILLIL